MMKFLALFALFALAAANSGYQGGYNAGPPVSYAGAPAYYQSTPVTYVPPTITFHPPSLVYNGQAVTYTMESYNNENGATTFSPPATGGPY